MVRRMFGLQSLSHCELVTDEGIRQLTLGLHLHDQLTKLELDNCPLITDTSLEHLKDCKRLEKIDVYDCVLISRAGIRRLRVSFVDVKCFNRLQSKTLHTRE